MRENRPSGSEGGAAQTNAPSLPLYEEGRWGFAGVERRWVCGALGSGAYVRGDCGPGRPDPFGRRTAPSDGGRWGQRPSREGGQTLKGSRASAGGWNPRIAAARQAPLRARYHGVAGTVRPGVHGRKRRGAIRCFAMRRPMIRSEMSNMRAALAWLPRADFRASRTISRSRPSRADWRVLFATVPLASAVCRLGGR